MSKHWNPQDELQMARRVRTGSPWPEGATVGLLLFATACFGFVMLLYQLAGPRDVFAP